MHDTDVKQRSPGDPTNQIGPDIDHRLARLTIETAKYLGRTDGESVPIEAVRSQAEANGYGQTQIDAILDQAGVTGESIDVPEQGDLFGDIWVGLDDVNGSGRRVPPSDSPPTDESRRIERFREWLQEKVDDDATGHSYSRRAADRRYARAKDVDRHFVDEYDTFSTVLITYCRSRSDDESIVDHADQFYPRSVVRKRRRILKELGEYDRTALISLLAPKHDDSPERPADRVPHPDAPPTRQGSDSGITHAHDFLWIPGDVSESDFTELADLTTADVHVSVERHVSSEVTTPEWVTSRGSGMDEERGDTTALPHEVGANLPLLRTELDARGLSDYAERWCAHMRLGRDDSLDTQGMHRFRTNGRFDTIADTRKWWNRVVDGVRNSIRLRSEVVGNRRAVLNE